MKSATEFDQRMVVHLHSLAETLLKEGMYRRLATVSGLLAGLSSAGWKRLGDEERLHFLEQMKDDFHVRAWDDWDWTEGNDYSEILSLIDAELRGLNGRQNKSRHGTA